MYRIRQDENARYHVEQFKWGNWYPTSIGGFLTTQGAEYWLDYLKNSPSFLLEDAVSLSLGGANGQA